jgi:hypothetical protein
MVRRAPSSRVYIANCRLALHYPIVLGRNVQGVLTGNIIHKVSVLNDIKATKYSSVGGERLISGVDLYYDGVVLTDFEIAKEIRRQKRNLHERHTT